MNIAQASIRKKTVTIVCAVLMVVLGIWSYIHLPRLEDPEFTIKDALIITPYQGASAQEVEKEISDVIERAVQQLEQLERVISRSERGRSTVTVTIKDQYDRHTLPQVWDELRRKVSDAQRQLPPGSAHPWCSTTSVMSLGSSMRSLDRSFRMRSFTTQQNCFGAKCSWCRTLRKSRSLGISRRSLRSYRQTWYSA